jgi:hypothetical protein
MTITKVLAVYKTVPIILVVESTEGAVCELSFADLHGAGHRFRTMPTPASSRRISCLPANQRQASTRWERDRCGQEPGMQGRPSTPRMP